MSFPQGTIIPGGGYLVIAKDPAAFLAGTGVEAVGPYAGSLSNGGEELRLRDRNDREMDRMEYDDRGDWPVGPDGSGVSLAKRDQNTFSDRAANWGSSVLIGGTPGRRNFGSDALASDVTLTLIDGDADWRYDDSGSDLGSHWQIPAFDDSNWSIGTMPFYAGDARLAGATPIHDRESHGDRIQFVTRARTVARRGWLGTLRKHPCGESSRRHDVAECRQPAVSGNRDRPRTRDHVRSRCNRAGGIHARLELQLMSILRPAVSIKALHGPTFW